MRHMIIGSGPAGVVAAESLRRLDPYCEITLIGDEPEPPYSRMAIPYLLIDRIDESGMYLRKSDGYFDTQKIEVLRDHVSAVSVTENNATLESGGIKGYDRLLIATGSSPTPLPIEGMGLEGVYPCWTLDDARAIATRAIPDAKVVLMGAGFIGCIILESLAKRGVELTVVELENRMVPRMMNQSSGDLIKRWCESRGVRVLTSTRVEGITNGKPLEVALSGGEVVQADLVISATGVQSNTGFLAGSGVEADNGILVNDRLETGCPGIFAAGDVAQGRDFSTGEYSVQAIQPTAVEHGQTAAFNMIEGRKLIHRGSLNMNILDTMGLVSTSFGAWEGVDGGESAELLDLDRYRYLNLQFDGDVLVGGNALGLTQHVGIVRGMIETRLQLGEWKDRLLENPLRLMEAYIAVAHGVSGGVNVSV